MAVVVQWWCSWFCVFFLIFLEDAVGISNADNSYYRYETTNVDPQNSFVNIDFFEDSHLLERPRRYLAGDSHLVGDLNRHLPVLDGLSEEHDEMKISAPTERTGATEHEPDAARLPSFPANASEPRTGGNYVPAKPENATKNSTAISIADSNRTSQPKNITEPGVSSTPPNQIPVTQIENTNVSLTNISVTNETTTLSSPGGTSNLSPMDDDIMITKFPEGLSNKTLADHNINETREDSHSFYNSTFISNNEHYGHAYWVNMTNNPDVHVNKMLSQSHRRAVTVKLSFDFPFYGHMVRNVTIATGGFLYTGDYVHSWLAATQYIAPLMANFDTSISPESFVKYVDNGTAFTVQWDKVKLQDKPMSGEFTFQATLLRTGDIVFVYQNVPVVIDNITDDHHPVKVGLSDAYIIDRTIFFVRRKTIFEYHRVNFDRQQIRNWTVIYLHALPTCLNGTDCHSCFSQVTNFTCKWCPKANRCSNGVDRHRQEWLQEDCDNDLVTELANCPELSREADVHESPSQASSVGQGISIAVEGTPDVRVKVADHTGSVTVSGVVGIMFLLGLLAASGLWMIYAYRNPHTASGQFLIRYRPSQWSWKRGEARYTAATIHM